MNKPRWKRLIKPDIIIMVVMLISITLILVLPKNKQSKDDLTDNISSQVEKELLGEDRVKAQDEIIKVIEKYIKDNKKEIENYLNKKEERTITIKELKEEAKVDISEFENLKYGCNSEFTTIDFSEDYSKHIISLTCDAFFKRK